MSELQETERRQREHANDTLKWATSNAARYIQHVVGQIHHCDDGDGWVNFLYKSPALGFYWISQSDAFRQLLKLASDPKAKDLLTRWPHELLPSGARAELKKLGINHVGLPE